ncbi:acyltransferase family protein [Gordonia sp. FQ]|uniref:acyltransferase family protein n=1 Tax=Gordonia sp. FQ TaxID=3446634 RepID=UPI003F83546C
MTTADSEVLASPNANAPGRRRDVEGLRGVAIMLVVVFHIWVGTVSGGVDAFLFISGFFLIPSLIRGQTGADPVNNPLPRLWRVLKRLWIPMALTVAVTVLATWYIYPSSRRTETLGGALWSDLFVENWALGLSGHTYADATSLPSPFQHLWSLAVQAQIFVILIGGITLLGLGLRTLARRTRLLAPERVRPVLIGIVAVLTIASFGYATFIGSADQSVNYYNTFSRFWEIALGGLVGLAAARLVVPARLRWPAGLAGITMLAVTGLLVDGATSFPGPAAMLPVGGTVLVFLAGTGAGSPVTRALSTRPMVYLGSIAYHLYLWHWPLLMMFLVYRDFHGTPVKHVSLLQGLTVIAVSLLLAVASDWLLKPDSPVRRLRVRVPLVLAGTVAALVVAIQAATSTTPAPVAQDIDWSLHPGAAASMGAATPPGVAFIPKVEASRADQAQTGKDGCANDGYTKSDLVICDYGAPREPGRPVLALVGGSHADHYLPALDLIGKEHDFTVETVLIVNCSLAAGPHADESTDRPLCRDWQKKAMAHVLETRPDAVFTTSTRPAANNAKGDETPQWYIDAFRTFSDAHIPVVGVRDLPWLKGPDGTFREPFDCMAVKKDPVACGVKRADALLPVDPAQAAVGGLPGVTLLDFNDLNCGPVDCPVVIGNVLVYRDAHHFTKTFMLTMTPFIERELGPALGWWPARH